MDFLLTTDSNYIKYLCVTMISVYENHDWHKIPLTFHILYNHISSEDKWRISEIADKYNQRVFFYYVSDDLFDSFPVGESWPRSCMYILLAHIFLPQELERVLYLDIDLVVNGDISSFYNLDFKDNYFIASKEWYDAKFEPEQPFAGLDKVADYDVVSATKGKYLNSGVLLFNLKKFRADQIDINYYKKKLEGLKNVFYDQGIICICFAQQTLLLRTCKYNYRLAFSIPDFYNAENRYYNISKKYEFYSIDAKIIHYCGNTGIKPWKLHLKHGDVPNPETAFLEIMPEYVPYIDIWWKYAELLPQDLYLSIKQEADSLTAAYRMLWMIIYSRGYTFYNALCIDNLKAPEWGSRNNVAKNSDLNKYIIPKVYICDADITGTVLNLPYEINSKTSFRLTVKHLSSNSFGITQILETDDDSMTVFKRHFIKEWSSWKIVSDCNMYDKIKSLEEQLRYVKDTEIELENLKKSLSYKLGRIITYIPRKFRNIIRNNRSKKHIK